MAERDFRAHVVGLLGLFVGILGLALTLEQRETSSVWFWTVFGLAFLVPVAMGNFSLPRFMRRGPDPALVASACRQVANSIDALWMERRDRSSGDGRGRGLSKQEWAIETKRLYDESLRPWALEVFDEAVACGALATGSRSAVQNPPLAQLHTLGDFVS